MNNKIQLVAIDLDGTLLNDAKQVSKQTVHALSCLTANHVKIVIASARPPRSVRKIYQQLNLNTLQINYNGALIWDEPSQTAFFHQPLPGSLMRQIVDIVRSLYNEVLVSCEIMDRWYTDRIEQSFTTETGLLFQPDVIESLDSFSGLEITKLMLLADPATIAKLQPILIARFHKQIIILQTDAHMLQIIHPDAGKAAALKRVAEHYNIPLSNVLAIGDAPNDVGMLQIAGIGVAMDNAHPVTKKVADWIAPTNNDHGVHAALLRYVCAIPDRQARER